MNGAAFLGLIGAGILGGLAHIVSTEAMARAPVSVLAPFEYTGLIWALLFDIILFTQVPDIFSISGCILILSAAIMVGFGDQIMHAIRRFIGQDLSSR